MSVIPSCITRPMIGVNGACGYSGESGLNLDMFGISLRKAANVTDDELSGKKFLTQAETNAIIKVIGDLKKEIGKKIQFTPVNDIISKPWVGKINVCKIHDGTSPFGLRFENPCRDNFRKNKLNWIELNVDSAFDTTAYIIDGEIETPFELSFVKGLNRKNINYTFEHEDAYLWITLQDGAVAYQAGTCCDCDGLCACNSCVNVYSVEMIDSSDEQCEPILDYVDSELYPTLDNPEIVNPVSNSLSYGILGYQVTCLCSYDWLFCQFQNEIAYAVALNMGVQVYEKAKMGERFNPTVEAASAQADYYLLKWLGTVDRVTGVRINGEYGDEIKAISAQMISYIEKSGTKCLPCNGVFSQIESLP